MDAMSKRKRIAVVLVLLTCVCELAGYLVAVWPSLTREPVRPPRGERPQAVEGGGPSHPGAIRRTYRARAS